MKTQNHISNVHHPVAIPYLQPLENPVFQQDNVRPNTALVTTRSLGDPQDTILQELDRSPDHSSIEHVWT